MSDPKPRIIHNPADGSNNAEGVAPPRGGAFEQPTRPPPPPYRRPAAPPPPPPAAPPPAPSSPPQQRHSDHDGIINKTLFKCRKCKLLFWTTTDAAMHERSCDDFLWYNCSVCQVLRFRSRAETVAHERTCPGPQPLRMADLPLAERVEKKKGSSAATAAGGGGGAPTAGAAASPIGSAVDRVERAGSSDKKIDKKRIGNIIDTYKNQIKRGGSANNDDVVDLTEDSPTDATNRTDSSVEAAGTKPAPPQAQSSAAKGDAKQTGGSDDAKNEKGLSWTTVWTCDVCKTEQFDSFEAACEHEKTCKGVPKGKGSRPQDASPEAKGKSDGKVSTPSSSKSPSPSKKRKRVTHDKATLFSPMLRDSSDSSSYTQLSKFHRLVLKSIKLLHTPFAESGGGAVSFKCQFCSKSLRPGDSSPGGGGASRAWTLERMATMLPSMVLTHVTDGCKSVPPSEGSQLPLAKSAGKVPFDEFLSVFLSENGIVERPEDGRGVVVLPDEEFMGMPGYQNSKRGLLLTGGKKKRGRPYGGAKTGAGGTTKRRNSAKSPQPRPAHKDVKHGDMGCRLHSEESGHIFTLAPLDGMPFVTSFSREEAKELRPAEKFLLQQLEMFTISHRLAESANLRVPPEAVGVRCRNCIADKNGCCFMKLSSVSRLDLDLLLLAREHVVGCKFMKAKDVKVIQDLENGEYRPATLSRFCKHISRLYCLEDSKDGAGVIWGDSPSVSSGTYSSPADVDLSLVLGKTLPKLEPEGANPPAKVAEEDMAVVAPPPESATKPADLEPPTKETSTPEVPSSSPKRESPVAATKPSSTTNNSPDMDSKPTSKATSPDMQKLTHYHHAMLMQFVIVPSQRKIFATDVSKAELQGDGFSSLTIETKPSLTASFKCKHCDEVIGTPTSMEEIGTILSHFPAHTECCPKIPPEKKEELASCKRTLLFTTEDEEGEQQSNTAGVDRCIQYARDLCKDVYGMVNAQDSDGATYVGFSNLEKLKAKYGRKSEVVDSSGDSDTKVGDTVLSLPMIERLF